MFERKKSGELNDAKDLVVTPSSAPTTTTPTQAIAGTKRTLGAQANMPKEIAVPSCERHFSFKINGIIDHPNYNGNTPNDSTTAAITQLPDGKFVFGLKAAITLFDKKNNEQKVLYQYESFPFWFTRTEEVNTGSNRNPFWSKKEVRELSEGPVYQCYSLLFAKRNSVLIAGVIATSRGSWWQRDSRPLTKLLIFNSSNQLATTIDDAPIHCMHETKDGNIIVGGLNPQKVNCYHPLRFNLLWSIDESATCMTTIYNAENSILLIGSQGSGFVKLYDLNTQRKIKEIKIHQSNINQIVYLGNNLIATTGGGFWYSTDNDIVITNIRTGCQEYRLSGHQARIKDLILAPNNYLISNDGWNTHIWCLSQKQQVKSFSSGNGQGRIYLTDDNWLLVRGREENNLDFHSFSLELDQSFHMAELSLPLTQLQRNLLATKAEEMKKTTPIHSNSLQAISEILNSPPEVKTISLNHRMVFYFEDQQSFLQTISIVSSFPLPLWSIVLKYLIYHIPQEESQLETIPRHLQETHPYCHSLVNDLINYRDSLSLKLHHRDRVPSLLATCSLFTISKEALQIRLQEEKTSLKNVKAKVSGRYCVLINEHLLKLKGRTQEISTTPTRLSLGASPQHA